jgi:hypothetical protein
MVRRIIVLLLAACSFSYAGAALAQTPPEKAIVGRWFVEVTEPIAPDETGSTGELRVLGVDEYLADGTLNGQGQIIMLFKYSDGATLEAAWQTTSRSEWRIADGVLTEKILDVKATPDYVKANGKAADQSDQEEFFRQANFTVEDLMPRGQTTRDQIISIDADRFVYDAKDAAGNQFRRTKVRTTKDFSSYKKS